MKKQFYLKLLTGLFLSLMLLDSGCEKRKSTGTGFLKGTISIGPLCPVERIPPDPGCLPTAETYKAYPVSVFNSAGKTKILQLMPSIDGAFEAELPAGNYTIVLEKEINIGSSNLPSGISVIADDTTLFNVNIDTGIR